jgi:hypothetical protein
MPSHDGDNAGDGTVEATWPWRDIDVDSCWRQCFQVASDGATEVTWPRCDVGAESCWQQCC